MLGLLFHGVHGWLWLLELAQEMSGGPPEHSGALVASDSEAGVSREEDSFKEVLHAFHERLANTFAEQKIPSTSPAWDDGGGASGNGSSAQIVRLNRRILDTPHKPSAC